MNKVSLYFVHILSGVFWNFHTICSLECMKIVVFLFKIPVQTEVELNLFLICLVTLHISASRFGNVLLRLPLFLRRD